ncbi:MAG: ABC transporter permease [Desulfurococcales archaeon]|nr:ABC transporter permease [Desulfurococcales archaeon]
MGGYTPSKLQVLRASLSAYARDVLALYSAWGFILVRLSVPVFMVATAWALSKIASPSGLVASLGYVDYVGYVALGFAFFTMLTTTLFEVGERIHREMVQGTLETVLLTPASRLAWLIGGALGSLMISMADVALVTVYYVTLFRGEVHLGGAPYALAGLLLSLAGMTGMGIALAGIVVNLKEPHAFNVMLTPFLMLLSGMMFPVEALPGPVEAVSRLIPVTHGIEVVRSSLLQGEPAIHLLGILALEAIAYTVVGYTVFRLLEARARRLGGLGSF